LDTLCHVGRTRSAATAARADAGAAVPPAQEMYAFTLSCYKAGIRGIDLHLRMMAQPPYDEKLAPFYLLHYTYGMDYTLEGVFTPGERNACLWCVGRGGGHWPLTLSAPTSPRLPCMRRVCGGGGNAGVVSALRCQTCGQHVPAGGGLALRHYLLCALPSLHLAHTLAKAHKRLPAPVPAFRPAAGKYGEWRFDKRSYASRPPGRGLSEPPAGMKNELVRHLIHAINEATEKIPGGWVDAGWVGAKRGWMQIGLGRSVGGVRGCLRVWLEELLPGQAPPCCHSGCNRRPGWSARAGKRGSLPLAGLKGRAVQASRTCCQKVARGGSGQRGARGDGRWLCPGGVPRTMCSNCVHAAAMLGGAARGGMPAGSARGVAHWRHCLPAGLPQRSCIMLAADLLAPLAPPAPVQAGTSMRRQGWPRSCGMALSDWRVARGLPPPLLASAPSPACSPIAVPFPQHCNQHCTLHVHCLSCSSGRQLERARLLGERATSRGEGRAQAAWDLRQHPPI
jgi:hypothetical protein